MSITRCRSVAGPRAADHDRPLRHATTELLNIKRKAARFLHRSVNCDTAQKAAACANVAG